MQTVPSYRSVLLRPSARAAGVLGLAATAVILVGAMATAIAYTGRAGEAYSPLNHFISELGENSQSRLALVFNAGIFVGGIGLGLFLLILSSHLTGRYRPGLVAVAIVAGASGSLVGLFPMDAHAAHRIVSGVFFFTGWILAAIFSLWLAAHPRSGWPRWLVAAGVAVVAVFIVFIAVYATYQPADPNAAIVERAAVWAVPLLEWASLLSLLAWFVAMSLVLVRQGSWPAAE